LNSRCESLYTQIAAVQSELVCYKRWGCIAPCSVVSAHKICCRFLAMATSVFRGSSNDDPTMKFFGA